MKAENDPYFENVAKKYCLITCTAIMTSILGIITYGYFNILITGAIDGIINTNCVLLYERRMNRYYEFLCFACHRSSVKSRPKLKIENNTNEPTKSGENPSGTNSPTNEV